MGLLDKAKQTATEQMERRQEQKERERVEGQVAAAAHSARLAALPRWEYKVKWIGEDKQKGLLGAGRMETIFNEFGRDGWELVAINMERATFKRPAP